MLHHSPVREIEPRGFAHAKQKLYQLSDCPALGEGVPMHARPFHPSCASLLLRFLSGSGGFCHCGALFLSLCLPSFPSSLCPSLPLWTGFPSPSLCLPHLLRFTLSRELCLFLPTALAPALPPEEQVSSFGEKQARLRWGLRVGVRLTWKSACRARAEPQVWPPSLCTLSAVVQATLGEVEVGGSGIHGHPHPHSQFKAILGYQRSCLKKEL